MDFERNHQFEKSKFANSADPHPEPMRDPEEQDPVTLEVEFDETDTVFLTFDGGGTSRVVDISHTRIAVIGDNPLPSPLEQYEEETDVSYSWKAVLPRDEKGVWSVFINSIQVYNL